MWITNLDIFRPREFETLRERLRGADTDLRVSFSDHGDIRLISRSHAGDAAGATAEALDRLRSLELEIERRLSTDSVTTFSGTKRNRPDLVGLAESAEILKVSKSRVSQLSGHPRFPRPVVVLAMGPVYVRDDMMEFAKARRERTDGDRDRPLLARPGEQMNVRTPR